MVGYDDASIPLLLILKEPTMSAADFWNKRYQTDEFLFGVEPNDFIRAVTPEARSGAKAFAPADGEGRNGVFLAQLGYQVTSVDVSEFAIEKARALAKTHDVTIDSHIGDVFEFPCPEDHYDLVIVCFMHFLPDDHVRFVDLLKRALKQGGVLIMEGYTLDQLPLTSGGPKNPEMLWSVDMIAADFADFDIMLLQETRRFLAEGNRHQGQAATLQFLGRKPTA